MNAARRLRIVIAQFRVRNGIGAALRHRAARVVDQGRRIIVCRRDGDGEGLVRQYIPLPIVHVKAKAVRGGVAAVVHVDQKATIDVGLGEVADRGTWGAGQLQLAVDRTAGRRVVDAAGRLRIVIAQLRIGDRIGAAFRHRAARVVDQGRRIRVYRRDGDGEGLAHKHVPQAVVHVKVKAVRGRAAPVVYVDQQATIDVGLGEGADRDPWGAGQLQLAVDRTAGQRVGHAARRLRIVIEQFRVSDRIAAALKHRAARVVDQGRRFIVCG